MRNVILKLSNGLEFSGKSFGYEKTIIGEVVFNTAMVGYPESLTDPSYAGQFMVLTFPLIGNYGVPQTTLDENNLGLFIESSKIHASAIIVSDYCDSYSHWNGVESLSQWLKRENVVGITGIDTRALTKLLREEGVMTGQIIFEESSHLPLSNQSNFKYENINYVDQVSCKEIINYNSGNNKKKVILVDCGVKHNIIRSLLKRDVEIIRVPWDYNFNNIQFDGLFLSNGPGSPETCIRTVEHLKQFFSNSTIKPCMGICMGNQLIGKAIGGRIYKLKYGHRSHNQPVQMVHTNRCFITSQNHGFAVDNKSIPSDWNIYFKNLNDGSNEGLIHSVNPWFSVQFHPEACSGPLDTDFLFDNFISSLS